MNIAPTLEGGLAIEPSSDLDWEVLEMITKDIGRPAHLAESLAGLMADESEWEEYVVPDLKMAFNNQSHYVAAAIQNARDNNERVLFIKPNQAEKWYGAINQARIALEARYQLDALEDFEDVPEELRSAYFRGNFYHALQSELLGYVMGAV